MVVVTHYKGVAIFEDYGFYTCSLDTTVEARTIEAIVRYIDGLLVARKPEEPITDMFIVTECIIRSEFWDN